MNRNSLHLSAFLVSIWIIATITLLVNTDEKYRWTTSVTDPLTGLSYEYTNDWIYIQSLEDIILLLNITVGICYFTLYGGALLVMSSNDRYWYQRYYQLLILVAIYPFLLIFVFVTYKLPAWESPFVSAVFEVRNNSTNSFYYDVPNVTSCYSLSLSLNSSYYTAINKACLVQLNPVDLDYEVNIWTIIMTVILMLSYIPLLGQLYYTVINNITYVQTQPLTSYHSFR